MITLGHELTHKEKEVSCFPYLFDLKFCAWINEVHADFGGAQKMFDCSRDALLNSIDYKLKYKKEHQQGDIEDCTHPSWSRRKFYVENYDFGKRLIKKIAKDTNCNDKMLINKIMEYYEVIELEPKLF